MRLAATVLVALGLMALSTPSFAYWTSDLAAGAGKVRGTHYQYQHEHVGHYAKAASRRSYARSGGGNVHSKTGASATVASRYAPAFQALIDDLEAHGAVIKFMGGYRSGQCGQASKHPCGMALDICQYARDVVDRRCGLSRMVVAELAAKHGLFSGGLWCNPDFGHVEAGGSAECGQSWAHIRRRSPNEHYASH